MCGVRTYTRLIEAEAGQEGGEATVCGLFHSVEGPQING